MDELTQHPIFVAFDLSTYISSFLFKCKVDQSRKFSTDVFEIRTPIINEMCVQCNITLRTLFKTSCLIQNWPCVGEMYRTRLNGILGCVKNIAHARGRGDTRAGLILVTKHAILDFMPDTVFGICHAHACQIILFISQGKQRTKQEGNGPIDSRAFVADDM